MPENKNIMNLSDSEKKSVLIIFTNLVTLWE